jgi:hypothetical protein
MKDKESLRGICGWIFISGKAENCYQSADVIKRVRLPFSRTLKKSIRFRRDIPPVEEGISNDRNCCVRNDGQIGRSGPGNPPTMVLATVERAGKTKEGTAPLPHSAPELIVTMMDYLFRIYHFLGEPEQEGVETPVSVYPGSDLFSRAKNFYQQ